MTYLWDFGDGSTGTVEDPQHIYNLTGTYNVGLMVYDTNGCASTQSFSGMITVFPGIEAEFSYSPTSVSSLDPNVFFYDHSTNAAYWNWSFGDTLSGINNHSFDQSPIHSFYGPGTYTIWLIATNSSGCVDSVAHVVEVKEPLSFFVPNAFTPNNNGINDVFLPIGLGIDPDNFTMYIFDRWGEEIYMTNDINKGWDGKKTGSDELCQMSVYVWLIDYSDIYGNHHKLTGKVTLIQ